jgi:uncharacterized protein YukE
MKIGGDIGGLRAVAASLSGVVDEIRDTGEYLSKRVDHLVSDAGWSGAAAEQFRGAWEQDATALVELSDCTKIVGRCLSHLADALDSAQHQLDNAVVTAKAAGMPFYPDDEPVPGPYTGRAVHAAAQFFLDVGPAQKAAKVARDTAIEELHAITSVTDGDGSSSLTSADRAALAGVLYGYYTLPNAMSEDAKGKLDSFNRDYRATQRQRNHSPARSKAKAALTEQLRQSRIERERLQTKTAAAERIADRFKGGRLLGSSVGSIADSLGVLQDGGKLSRVLDGLPALDVVIGGLATWAQATEDHEKGWSWTHAILADGGSNVAAIGAGLATDCIPYAGPFLAPFVSYGVGAWTYEATHEGHWTEHIHEDGVVVGTAEGLVDTDRATWNNDGWGMLKKVGNDVRHPDDAGRSLWRGVTSLF